MAVRGISHVYAPKLVAFEHDAVTAEEAGSPQNVLIWIGGLSDGLLTVSYPHEISKQLPKSWSLAQVLLSSSYTGWGISSLIKDAQELSECVRYFRAIRSGKIVLMGHSTGCQDVMEYLTGRDHLAMPPIDGGILQAPVSDRETFVASFSPEFYARSCRAAQELVDAGRGEEIMPSSETKGLFEAPCCARRWLSLASPKHDGDDDYFSSDLTDEQLMRTFGGLPPSAPLCVLFSGSDEYMPGSIDKEAVLRRWIAMAGEGKGVIDETHSGVVGGASHNLEGNPKEVVEELVTRVINFVNTL